MMDLIGIALSATLAHLATNLDNLAIMVGLMVTIGQFRTVAGYLVAQIIMVGAAFVVSEGVEAELPNQVGYLGAIPIVLGLYALWQRHLGNGQSDTMEATGSGLVAIVALFVSVSFDSFAVLTPLLADSRDVYTVVILIGVATSALLLAAVGLGVSRMAPNSADRIGQLEWFAPYVMIAIGLYVILNTGTDLA